MSDSLTDPEKSISDALALVLAQLSRDQLRFVVAMQEYPTKGEAAAAIGIKPDTVYHWPKVVDEALLLLRRDVAEAARAMNRRALLKAMAVKVAGLDSDDETVRQRTATELIEWQLGKATQPTDVTSNGQAVLPPVREMVVYVQKVADGAMDGE